ncbi:Multidrug resistance protein mexA precursor [Moraxella caprae]|uniref:Multidrug resistance protein mexA n=1 Tax=Moraxella caprae TaxID=90240 RepID=A0A378R2I2_9GAMM|nr:efflux RND transporter periplasmic adaptor subunit [Moraxella caprae]STZ09218.1 Multidrug resistance protein mexA precursor [Moraxella caprae]
MKFNLKVLTFSVLVATAALVGCGKNDQGAGGAGAGAGATQQMPPATVEVQTVSLRSIPVVKSFSGRVTAVETSEVRPQVTGIIESVAFQEGSYVKAGQELYRLNRDNYISAANSSIAAIQTAEASLISARASLAAQEATLAQARADLARVESLVGIDAVSKQLYDQHKTAVRTAQANVEAAKATVNQANASINSAKANRDASQLDMSRTIIRAPISGKIGISAVTAGALVSASQATPLATISRTDMVYVDISQSSSELLRLRQQMASGQASEGSTEVQIVLEDGETYPLIGRLALSDASVDEATGAVKLRAVFPNPDGLLIPGMYVNANLAQSVVHNAMLLPQTAIIRTPKGETQVYVVNQNKQIEMRNVKTAGTFQGQWVVTDGLTNGDNVVVVGGAKVKPEQAVETRPYSPNGQNPQGVGQAPAQGPVQSPNQAPSHAPQQSKTSQQGRQEQQAPATPTQNRAPTDDGAEQAEAQAMADAADEVVQ